MSLPLNSIVIPPAQGHPHTHTVIFLHGRGDDNGPFRDAALLGQKWRDSRGRSMAEALPTFRWVLPQAPMRTLVNQPPPGGASCRIWFDNWNVRDLTEREKVQADGLREVIPLLRDLVSLETERLGGGVVVAGFSQGGAAGAHLLFNSDRPLAAFMGFSCRCPFAGRSLSQMREVVGVQDGVPDHDDFLRDTPLLLEHCVDDPIVPLESGRVLRDVMRGFGCDVDAKEYPDGGHWLHSPTGLDDVVKFLEKNVIGKGA
ncbi:phospholipase/carboxylesterase family protein [Xylariaceae sp. FL0594]|nr:phospholipase/carboxylesterase family protein [Xylariaceae sp. FL0594]